MASAHDPATYGSALVALSVLVSDANFVCPALQVDRWTSRRVPTFAYHFNDDTAPQRFDPSGKLPTIATHSSEIQYLLDEPTTPVQATLNADQEALAAIMRAAWANFAATGNPSSRDVPWPSIGRRERVLSLEMPGPVAQDDFASSHHCGFWAEV